MKAILHPISVDLAAKAHNCHHNKKHRIERGQKRLKFKVERSYQHFCVPCAQRMLDQARVGITEIEQLL